MWLTVANYRLFFALNYYGLASFVSGSAEKGQNFLRTLYLGIFAVELWSGLKFVINILLSTSKQQFKPLKLMALLRSSLCLLKFHRRLITWHLPIFSVKNTLNPVFTGAAVEKY